MIATSNRVKYLLVCGVIATSQAHAAPSGLTFDESGIVVAGARGARKAYAPLDVPRILPGFIGVWSVRPEICDEVLRSASMPSRTPNGVVWIVKDRIMTKSGALDVAGTYVRTPPPMTPKDIETALAEGKKILFSAARGAERQGDAGPCTTE